MKRTIRSFMYGKEGKGKDYRPEQMRCKKILENFLHVSIDTEYRVTNLTIDGYKTKDAILDIAIPKKKLAIRMNGGIHKATKRARDHDENQKYALEEAGWKVIDFFEDEFPLLWDTKKDIKDEEVINEVINNIIK